MTICHKCGQPVPAPFTAHVDNLGGCPEVDAPLCGCGTLTDLGGPGPQHDGWCPLYLATAPCSLCGHAEHGDTDCGEQVGYDHLNGDHECECPGTLVRDDAARLSRLLFSAREQVEMWADVVESQTSKPAHAVRELVTEIDAYRAERGWSPDGFGGET